MGGSRFELLGYRTQSEYEDAVVQQVRLRLDVKVAALIDIGAPLMKPADLADAMIAIIPDAAVEHPYTRMGPFYSSKGVSRLLRIRTKQALSDRRERGTVLAAQTQDATWVYPAFQFDAKRGRVRPELVPVLAALRGAPRWGAALFLTTPNPELDGQAPERAAVERGDDVVLLAQQYLQAVTGR